jgi:hypothetical protein
VIEVEDRTDPNWLRHKIEATLELVWLYTLRVKAADLRDEVASASDPWDDPETIGGE